MTTSVNILMTREKWKPGLYIKLWCKHKFIFFYFIKIRSLAILYSKIHGRYHRLRTKVFFEVEKLFFSFWIQFFSKVGSVSVITQPDPKPCLWVNQEWNVFGSIVTRPVFHHTNCPCYDRFWAGPRIWTVPSVLAGSGILKSSDPVFGKVGAGSGFSLNSQIQNLSEIDFSFIVYIRIGNLSFDGEGGGVGWLYQIPAGTRQYSNYIGQTNFTNLKTYLQVY